MQRVILNVRGLHSKDCAQAVCRSLKSTSGVSGVMIDQPSRSACVEHDECLCNVGSLISAVADAGCQVDGYGMP